MLKINMKPVASENLDKIQRFPSRRFKRIGHSICGHKYVTDAKATSLVIRTVKEQEALIRAIENRLFKI